MKREFKTYLEWGAAVDAAGLNVEVPKGDAENGPSPGDVFQPCMALNDAGDSFGMYQWSGNPDEREHAPAVAVLFDDANEFARWVHEGDAESDAAYPDGIRFDQMGVADLP